MARKVRFDLTIKVVINESDLALLRLLDGLAAHRGTPVSITARFFSDELGLSLATVRRSCRNLVASGLVVVRPVHRDDGGWDANTYEITRLGDEVLRSKGQMRPRHVPSRASGPAVTGTHGAATVESGSSKGSSRDSREAGRSGEGDAVEWISRQVEE